MGAAQLWRWLFVGELGCAAGLAALPAVAYSLSPTTVVLLIVFIALIGLPFLVVGASLVTARITATAPQRGTRAEVLQVWLTETLAFEWAMLVMSIEPCLRFGRGGIEPEAPGPGGPVLLIHGFVCNGAIWRPLTKALRSHGFGPVRALNLEPLFGDIDSYAAHVAAEVRRLSHECNGVPVSLVTHSMGGLVARAALRLAGPEDIRQIVTLAAPHHGSWFARLAGNRPCQQMRPDSPWLASLNSDQSEGFPVPVATLYSLDDNLVSPATSAILGGASVFEMRGIGHLGQLIARESIDCTLAALSRPRVGQRPCLT